MPVYFIRSGDTGPVKIGWAADVEKRRKYLQVGHPYPLQVVRVIPVARGSERWLQRRYEATKLLGEWFVFEAEMLTVEPPDLAIRKRPRKPKPKPVISVEMARSVLAKAQDDDWRKRFWAERCKPAIDPCDQCRTRDGLPLRPYRLVAA